MTKPTITGLRQAIETRDSQNPTALYADVAVITITGVQETGAFLNDVYSRDTTHTVESDLECNTLAFVQGCRHGEGAHVIASSITELWTGGLVRQMTGQA